MSLLSQLIDPEILMSLDSAELARLESATTAAVLENTMIRNQLAEQVKNWSKSIPRGIETTTRGSMLGKSG